MHASCVMRNRRGHPLSKPDFLLRFRGRNQNMKQKLAVGIQTKNYPRPNYYYYHINKPKSHISRSKLDCFTVLSDRILVSKICNVIMGQNIKVKDSKITSNIKLNDSHHTKIDRTTYYK